jgi:hypothetical protein
MVDPSGARALSFAHGQYDDRVLRAARALQYYHLLFSSDAVLNRCENGGINGDLWGRIPVKACRL